MRALRLILFGVVLAVFALFSFSNWTRVPVILPNGSTILIFLPVVVFAAFLIGWLPVILLHLASRASWRRRTARVERLLEEATVSNQRGTPVVPAPAISQVSPVSSGFIAPT